MIIKNNNTALTYGTGKGEDDRREEEVKER
jgi:hypothetical protein